MAFGKDSLLFYMVIFTSVYWVLLCSGELTFSVGIRVQICEKILNLWYNIRSIVKGEMFGKHPIEIGKFLIFLFSSSFYFPVQQ